MIGKTISHYKILEKLGEGGMGIVYLAEDTKLDRKVALKFLPKEYTKDKAAKERFEREAKAAAALNHSNIVTIYEINEHEDQIYIAMEYVEGSTLKDKIASGPLPLAEVLGITVQICEGLQKAHEAGIVHRDIKPQNIIINKDRKVKILDFGLAKLKGVSQLTKESSTLGTVHYLSPEQAMGKEVDHRTDIWSLGVILFEMLTGELPFKGDYEQAVIYSILNEKLNFLSGLLNNTPKELEDLANKMLEKDPDKRFQNINGIKLVIKDISDKFDSENKEQKKTGMSTVNKNKKFVLAGVSASIIITFIFIYIFILPKPPPLENKSIAVLPFKNMSNDSQNEYFCDGITEDIITMLSKIKDLKVTSRTSVFYFKNKNKKIKDIARELKVETILEGSVRQAGGKVRITAQLINARTDDHLWAETYDRELKDIFVIQSDVANQIAKILHLTLLPSGNKRYDQRPTKNMEAYKLYLQGKSYWHQRNLKDLRIAIDFFQKAVELDSSYALGYAGLAQAYSVIGDLGFEKPLVVYPKAEEYCLKALSLDSELAEAHAALGSIKNYWTWDFPGAEKALKKAISLNPGYATAHQWLAEYYSVQGNFDLAHKQLDLAEELDPFSFITKIVRANIYLAEKKYNKSIEQVKLALKKFPGLEVGRFVLITAYLRKKSYDKVRELAEKSQIPLMGKFVNLQILISQGKTENARKIVKDMESKLLEIKLIYPGIIAIIYAGIGDMDNAVKWYKKAIDQRDLVVLSRYGIGFCEPLLNDPRVQEMLRKVGLEK